MLSEAKNMKKVIINANTDLGLVVNGTNLGPRLITKDIKNIDIYNVDKKDIIKSTDKNDLRKNFDAVNDMNERLYNEIIKHDEFCITIGGDHVIGISTGLASIKKHKDIGILWIDAHPDYNTYETTITGNLHGMPLAEATGVNGTEMSYFHDENYIKPTDTVVVGARSIDPGEQDNLNKNDVLVISTNELRKDIYSSMEKAFNRTNKKLHISFDLDLIDPTLARGVSVPEVDGITFEEAEVIFDYLIEHKNRIVSLDIVEYNPLRDKDDVTLKFAIKLLNKVIDNF